MAGNITNFIETWRTITSDSIILDMVKGCHLEFDAEPVQNYAPKHLINYTHREKGIIEVDMIAKLLLKELSGRLFHLQGNLSLSC